MTEHLCTTASCVYLLSFLEHLFYREPLENCLFHAQVAEFQPADTAKRYLKYSSIRTKSIHSKMFIYLKSLKIVCEEVNSYWSCEMPGCKKNSFGHFPSCILPSFSQKASRLLLPQKLWKCASTISFRKYKGKVVLLVIYQFN